MFSNQTMLEVRMIKTPKRQTNAEISLVAFTGSPLKIKISFFLKLVALHAKQVN